MTNANTDFKTWYRILEMLAKKQGWMLHGDMVRIRKCYKAKRTPQEALDDITG